MRVMHRWGRVCVSAGLVAMMPAAASAQSNLAREYERLANQVSQSLQSAAQTAGSNPLSGPPVRNAPFSADATTTVTQTLADGTRIEQSSSSRFYRDRAGRVRVEQMIMGLDPLNSATQAQTIVTIDPDPGDAQVYTLDSAARTARRGPRAIAGVLLANGGVVSMANGGFTLSSGNAQIYIGRGPDWTAGSRVATPDANAVHDESLGTRQFDGIKATGRRITMTIPVGQIGNDRPIDIVDERWESPELKMTIYSRSSDPRTGVVEYRLTNIVRTEPPADLFVVPPDYTVLGGLTYVPQAQGRGQRGGGGRGQPGGR